MLVEVLRYSLGDGLAEASYSACSWRSTATAAVQRAGRGLGRAAGRSGRCLTGTAARRRSRNRRCRSAFVRATRPLYRYCNGRIITPPYRTPTPVDGAYNGVPQELFEGELRKVNRRLERLAREMSDKTVWVEGHWRSPPSARGRFTFRRRVRVWLPRAAGPRRLALDRVPPSPLLM